MTHGRTALARMHAATMMALFLVTTYVGAAGEVEGRTDPQQEGLLAILLDDVPRLKSAFGNGLDISVCPKMAPPSPGKPPSNDWVILNGQLNEKNGYDLSYWAAAFGSEEIRQVFRENRVVLPSDKSSSVRQKALLARFELLHIDLVYDMISIINGLTDEEIPPLEELADICSIGNPSIWGRQFTPQFRANARARYAENKWTDPFGNPYLLLTAKFGPKISPKTIELSKGQLGVSETEFWGQFFTKTDTN